MLRTILGLFFKNGANLFSPGITGHYDLVWKVLFFIRETGTSLTCYWSLFSSIAVWMCCLEAAKNRITFFSNLITIYDLLLALILVVNGYAFYQQNTHVDVFTVISE